MKIITLIIYKIMRIFLLLFKRAVVVQHLSSTITWIFLIILNEVTITVFHCIILILSSKITHQHFLI